MSEQLATTSSNQQQPTHRARLRSNVPTLAGIIPAGTVLDIIAVTLGDSRHPDKPARVFGVPLAELEIILDPSAEQPVL